MTPSLNVLQPHQRRELRFEARFVLVRMVRVRLLAEARTGRDEERALIEGLERAMEREPEREACAERVVFAALVSRVERAGVFADERFAVTLLRAAALAMRRLRSVRAAAGLRRLVRGFHVSVAKICAALLASCEEGMSCWSIVGLGRK